MGVTAARKAREIATNTESVLALEWMCAAQAREFHKELRAGRGAQAAHELLREHVKPLARDRYLHTDIETTLELLKSGALVETLERSIGALEA
jgi:histidine ammonia-lyase